MARAAKLKVYCMPAGFYDAMVAAPSQKAALQAWGTTTDLFAAGRASIVEDEALQAEALARPGEVVKRMRGDAAAMLGPEPAESPDLKPRRTKAAGRQPAEQKPAPPPPDRTRLAAAERAMAEAERDLSAELDALAAERAALDRRETETRSRSEVRLKALERARREEETTYDRAVARSAGARRR